MLYLKGYSANHYRRNSLGGLKVAGKNLTMYSIADIVPNSPRRPTGVPSIGNKFGRGVKNPLIFGILVAGCRGWRIFPHGFR